MVDGSVIPTRRARSRPAAPPPPGTGAAAGPAAGPGARSLAPVGKRPFRLPEIVLGVLLVAGCALGAVLWARSANTTTTVVVASRTIARGTVIGPDDLRGAQVGGETSAMISGDSAQALLGRIAVVDIGAGVPMSLTLLTDVAPLADGEALTSMALAPGQLPPDLSVDDAVRVLVTGPPAPVLGVAADATAADVTTLLDETAVVWSVDESPDGVSTVVTVRGSLVLSTAIASADEVRVVRIAGHP